MTNAEEEERSNGPSGARPVNPLRLIGRALRVLLNAVAWLVLLPLSLAASVLLAVAGAFNGWLLFDSNAMRMISDDCTSFEDPWRCDVATLGAALFIGGNLAIAATVCAAVAFIGWFVVLPRPSVAAATAILPETDAKHRLAAALAAATSVVSRATALALFACAAALGVFSAVAGAAMAVAAGALALIAGSRRRGRGLRALSILAAPAFALVSIVASAETVTFALHSLGDRALSRGPESLAVQERAALWVLAAAMPFGGIAIGAPNAALEQTRLLIPGAAEVVRESDFPMRSPMIRRFVEKHRADSGATTELWWGSYYEEFPHHDIALLFNGGRISVKQIDGACQAEAIVDVSYGPQYRGSTLVEGFGIRFAVDQAAYWALQEVGWLYPYTLRVQWEC